MEPCQGVKTHFYKKTSVSHKRLGVSESCWRERAPRVRTHLIERERLPVVVRVILHHHLHAVKLFRKKYAGVVMGKG